MAKEEKGGRKEIKRKWERERKKRKGKERKG